MPRPRLAFHQWPAAVYAIGDVHGCLDQLLELEDRIAADGLGIEGEKWLVTLGDHIDRGPHSADVIEHVMGPAPAGFRRFSLMGNHEAMLLDFLADPQAHAYYLDEGGLETFASYRSSRWQGEIGADDLIPERHRRFVESLPVYLALPGWLFVHAGIRPGVALAQQSDEDLLWIRAPFLSSQLTGGLRVVHGHTPGREIVVTAHRIDVDTQCFASGKLSAVRVTPDGGTAFFSVQL
jgi:serine/threonine protein phosphatase 1